MQAASNTYQDYLGPVKTDVKPEYTPTSDGSKMRALAWFGNRDVRMVDAPVPDITEPEDVILKVTGTTICGSDLHLYHGEIMTMQKGDILGHEFMGVIDKVGPGVLHLQPGQRVVASFQIACGKCSYCQKKLSSFCDRTNNSSLQNVMYGHRDAGFFGYSHFTGGFPGGQADYHAVVDTGVEKGDVVGIWGLGPIGLCAARWCQLKGASRVIGIDRVPERLALAKNKLGIETLDFSQYSDVPQRLAELVPGGIDVGIDCGAFHEPKTIIHKVQKMMMLETDSPETLNEMLLAVRKQGRIGLIAAYAGFANGVNVGALTEKGIRLIGNGQAPVHLYWKEILHDYIMTGKFDPTLVLTHRVPLEDMPKLYAAFDKRQCGVEKVFVETRFSSPPSKGCPTLTRVDEWSARN